MTKTLKDFTPEIQAKIPEYIDRYTKGVFDGGRYNSFTKENAEALIDWNYETAGYKKPVVIVAENPLESQILFNYITANKERLTPIIYAMYCLENGIELPKIENIEVDATQLDRQLDRQLRSQLGSQLRIQLDSQLDRQLRSQLGRQLRIQLDSQLRIQLDSQLDSQLRIQLDSQLDRQLRSQLGSQLGSQLDSQLHSELRSQLDRQLDRQLRSQLGSQLRIQLHNQLGSQLDRQLRSQLGRQLRIQLHNQLGSQLRKYNPDYLFTANVYTNSWLAWYKFMADELEIDAPINVVLNSWNDLYEKSGVYSAIFSELVCVVSKYPKKVHRNANNDLHNVDYVAVEWGASSSETEFINYCVDGFNLDKGLFEKLSNKEVTFEDFIKEENEEVKSAILSFYRAKFGDEFMFRFLSKNLKEIDTYTDKKDPIYLKGTTGGMNVGVYTLFSGRLMGESIAYVRCYCPSTDRMFFLGVEPGALNAKDAIASLYRVPRKLKQHIESINRQGEIYSTNFTNEGLSILKGMSKNEVRDLVGVDGNLYFDKIKYEY